MKKTVIMLFIGGSLLLGCNSNQRSSKSFGKNGSSAAAYKPAEKPTNTSSEIPAKEETMTVKEAEQPKTALDSLLMNPDAGTYRNQGANFQGSSGVGTGGSYASSAYRHDRLNRKKNEEKAMAAMKERKQLNQQNMNSDSITTDVEIVDSLSTEAIDSTQYIW